MTKIKNNDLCPDNKFTSAGDIFSLIDVNCTISGSTDNRYK